MRDLDFIGGLQQTGGADRREACCHGFALGGSPALTARIIAVASSTMSFINSARLGAAIRSFAGKMGAIDQRCERGRRYAGRAAFDLQVRSWTIRLPARVEQPPAARSCEP